MNKNSYQRKAVTAAIICASMGFPIKPYAEEATESDKFFLKTEYNLIMQKRSKLSKSKRDAVVAQYERLA